MNKRIIPLFYAEANRFITDKTLMLKKEYVYYALKVDGNIVSAIAVEEKPDYAKFHASYTPESMRGNGYHTELLSGVIDIYRKRGYTKFKANCTGYSVGIYSKCGFNAQSVTEYKRFSITRMVL